jgi:type I restriction enzyme M protein
MSEEPLEDSRHLPPPEVIAREIVEHLRAALDEFEQIAQALGPADSS